jgi:hypothetical protein
MRFIPETIMKDKKAREASEVWNYAIQHCTLKTAELLMDQFKYRFYRYNPETKMGKVTCCYCDFTFEAQVSKNKHGCNNKCTF